jgi:hypothetical protein
VVIITSADSRIRVLDGFELVHRFKGKKLLLTIFHLSLQHWFRTSEHGAIIVDCEY